MMYLRWLAASILICVAVAGAAADWVAPNSYATQFRDRPSQPPSRDFLLGTDELGRDRFSRLLYATRVSTLLPVLAAILATVLAGCIGIASGYAGGWLDRSASWIVDLTLSLPWLFALLMLRSLLPLNLPSNVSLAATFLLLAGVGWAFGARVVRASTVALRNSPCILHARAYGCSRSRILTAHVLPGMRPVLAAQFWILVPVFLLAEANLGILGLGVNEPIPSWGNMLGELQSYDKIAQAPWLLVPGIVLVIVITSLQILVARARTWE